MVPAAVYPVPEATESALALLLLLVAVVLPIYLLVFRPVVRRDTWGIAEMVGIAMLFILALPLLAIMAGLAEPITLVGLSVITIVQNALFVGLPAYVVTVRYGLTPARLGARFDGWPRLAAIGAVIALLTLPLSIGSENLAVFLLGLIEGPTQAAARAAAEHLSDPLQPILTTLAGVAPVGWVLFLLTVVVPIGEETFFRGFVYGGLRTRWGAVAGTLVSAAFFSAVHAQVVHGLPIFLLGVVLALLYERTGSLLPPMIAHAVNNVIAVLSVWRDWGF